MGRCRERIFFVGQPKTLKMIVVNIYVKKMRSYASPRHWKMTMFLIQMARRLIEARDRIVEQVSIDYRFCNIFFLCNYQRKKKQRNLWPMPCNVTVWFNWFNLSEFIPFWSLMLKQTSVRFLYFYSPTLLLVNMYANLRV